MNESYENEVRALKKLCQNQHPSIVQVFDYGQLRGDATCFIDMEICGITLGAYIGGKTVDGLQGWKTVCAAKGVEIAAFEIVLHIVNGLSFIHLCGEVHRDLTPCNGIQTLEAY